ncbi:hypothetical protein J6590_046370 [Homalodisca vitripennis]|nr:hypothetical protein J6590_046370 [Homalodisca vitripennis]
MSIEIVLTSLHNILEKEQLWHERPRASELTILSGQIYGQPSLFTPHWSFASPCIDAGQAGE